MTPAQLQAYLRWINSESAPGALGDAFLGGQPVTQLGNLSDIGSVNVLDVGAVGDGLTDDTAAFNTAIALASASGAKYNTVRVPATAGTGYLITSTLNITKSINLIGDGWLDDTSNPNGLITPGSSLIWGGSALPMVLIQSATLGNFLRDGSIQGISFDGANVATIAVRASSTNFWDFDIRVTNVVTAGLVLDDNNNVLSAFNRIRRMEFVYGTAVAVQNANGVQFTGTAFGCTQNIIDHISGLVYNGTMVQITGGDNNHIIHATASIQTGGTPGYTVSFLNGGPEGGSNNNLCDYVSGKIFGDTLNLGNRIISLNSEAGGVLDNTTTGNGIDYSVVDFGAGFGAVFDTPRRKMWDRLWLPAATFFPVSAVKATLNSNFTCGWALANNVGEQIGIGIPPPMNWGPGYILYILIDFYMDAANSGATVQLVTFLNHSLDGNAPTGVLLNTTYSPAVHNTQWSINHVGLLVPGGGMAITEAPETILLQIGRGNDAASGNVVIIGAGLVFTNVGPQTAGSGTYSIPAFVLPAGTTPVPSLPI